MKTFNAFLDKYYPEANRNDAFVVYGYTVAQNMVYVLKQCGDDLTRENVMKQAASIKGLEAGRLAARHHGQDQRDRLCSDPATAAAKAAGRDLASVWRHHQRRGGRLTPTGRWPSY